MKSAKRKNGWKMPLNQPQVMNEIFCVNLIYMSTGTKSGVVLSVMVMCRLLEFISSKPFSLFKSLSTPDSQKKVQS